MKETAEKLLRYYTRTQSRNGGDWKANIDAVQMWLALLERNNPSEAEISELLAKLDAKTIHRGTAWEELELYVQRWINAFRQNRRNANVEKNHVA